MNKKIDFKKIYYSRLLFLQISFATLLFPASSSFADVTATISNLRYGPYDKDVFDLYLPQTQNLPPVAIFLHGGGFKSGDKSQVNDGEMLDELLAAGIAVVAANYRTLSDSSDLTLDEILTDDLVRLVQYLRSYADSFGFDGNRMAAYGNSAGAGAALWLGVHDDRADSRHPDPIQHQSSKVQAVAHLAGQATYDTALWWRIVDVDQSWPEWTNFDDDLLWFGVDSRGELNNSAVREIKQHIDLMGLISADDATLYLENYARDTSITLSADLTEQQQSDARTKIAHSPQHAIILQRLCQQRQLNCEVHTFETDQGRSRGDAVEFLSRELLGSQ